MSTIKVDGIRSNSASSDAITLASNGTCTANITNNLSNKNLVINGAMTVAQAGTSGNSGSRLVDRFGVYNSTNDETPTQAQVDVASGTTPYTLGFRKSLKITNGNQTSGASSGSRIFTTYAFEAQDLATSGWNYTSASSNITLSFWVKSSVAQTFHGYLATNDGTRQGYSFETGSLTANTWTKITKTIPGNSNIQIDNNNESGLSMIIGVYWGTNFTDSGNTMNQWTTYDGNSRTPVNTTTWYTTNDATFEFTGVQLEVGSVATDFEHRSFGQELALCQRYFYVHTDGVTDRTIGNGTYYTGSSVYCPIHFPCKMRAAPSMTVASDGNGYWYGWYSNSGSNTEKGDNWSLAQSGPMGAEIYDPAASGTQGHSCFGRNTDSNSRITFSAEI